MTVHTLIQRIQFYFSMLLDVRHSQPASQPSSPRQTRQKKQARQKKDEGRKKKEERQKYTPYLHFHPQPTPPAPLPFLDHNRGTDPIPFCILTLRYNTEQYSPVQSHPHHTGTIHVISHISLQAPRTLPVLVVAVLAVLYSLSLSLLLYLTERTV